MSEMEYNRSLQLILTAVARPRLREDQSRFLLVDVRPVPGRSADVCQKRMDTELRVLCQTAAGEEAVLKIVIKHSMRSETYNN